MNATLLCLFSARAKKDTPEEAPYFPKGLRDTSADEDTPLIFSAPFLGNPIPEVVWAKDGVPLKPSDRITMTCDGTKVCLVFNSKISVGVWKSY